MRLQLISEAYDKALAAKVASIHGLDPSSLRSLVEYLNPSLQYGVWVLKQLANMQVGPRMDGTMGVPLENEDFQRSFKALLQKYDRFKEQLSEKDINKYTLESLQKALEPLVEDLDPGSLPGVDLLATEEIDGKQYKVYVFYNAESLQEASRDSGWCVKGLRYAIHYSVSSPMLVVFRASSPTAITDVYMDECNDGQNRAERRPEILKLLTNVIRKYGDQLREKHAAHYNAVWQNADRDFAAALSITGHDDVIRIGLLAKEYLAEIGENPNKLFEKLSEPLKTFLLSDLKEATLVAISLEQRWPELESMILSDIFEYPNEVRGYNEDIMDGHWPALMQKIESLSKNGKLEAFTKLRMRDVDLEEHFDAIWPTLRDDQLRHYIYSGLRYAAANRFIWHSLIARIEKALMIHMRKKPVTRFEAVDQSLSDLIYAYQLGAGPSSLVEYLIARLSNDPTSHEKQVANSLLYSGSEQLSDHEKATMAELLV